MLALDAEGVGEWVGQGVKAGRGQGWLRHIEEMAVFVLVDAARGCCVGFMV